MSASAAQLCNDQGQAGDEEANIQSQVDGLISQDRVVIFSKSTCPYCDDAKDVFEKVGQTYSEVDLNAHPQAGEIQDVLKEMTGARTVPRVFVDGKCIGGGSDTMDLYKTGRLQEILKPDSSPSQGYGRGENPADGCKL